MQIPEASSGRIETKIEFANTLRGLAALSVLISHYFYTFWKVPSAVAGLIGAPALPVRSNMITIAIDALLPEGLIGHFGVAIFFLISGFVIPFAFLTRSRLEFAIGRVFRLWPTYAVGLTLSSLAVWACAASFGQPRPFPTSTYLLQLLFVRDLWWVPSIDGIVWTLEIEAKFYLAAIVLAPAFR